MKLLIFDTETTGLPKSRKPSKEEPNNWPHIVSISWVVLNTDTNKIETEKSFLVKPGNWVIPEDSIKIHRITNEKAQTEGLPLEKVIGEFLSEQCDVLVAHNMEFDYNIVDNAIRWDLEMSFTQIKKPKICTMELGKNICNLKNLFGKPKPPKLSELYQHAFGSLPSADELHNSLYDVKILTKIIQEFEPLRVKMNLMKGEQPIVKKNDYSTNDPRVLSIRLE